MNNKQRSLFNKMNDIMKAFYEEYGSPVGNFNIEVKLFSIAFYTGRNSFDWEFIDKIKNLSDTKEITYEIGIDTTNKLYIKIW